MSENISNASKENTCGCPCIVNDNLCCSVKVNNQLCLLPPAKDCIKITFKIQPGVKIIQNAGELCVCGLVKKIVEYTGVSIDGCEIRKVRIRQDIPFKCCFNSCDLNEQDPSDYVVTAIEVENLCTTLASRATRAGVDVFFCLKETDIIRVRLSKPTLCELDVPVTLTNELESFVF